MNPITVYFADFEGIRDVRLLNSYGYHHVIDQRLVYRAGEMVQQLQACAALV